MYNQGVQTGRAGYSLELLQKRSVRRLHSHAGWIVFGLAGGLVVLCYFMFRPFVFEDGLSAIRKTAMWFAAWFLAFTELYLLFSWLAPQAHAEEQDLAHLPLPAGQHFLHRMFDLAAVPLAHLALSLPLFWIALVFYGMPYNEGVSRWWRWFNWDWNTPASYDPDPWGLRVALIFANLALAVLLPVTVAMLLDLALPWVLVRAALLPVASVGAYFLVRHPEVRYDLFRIAYQQTRGYSAWAFIATGAALVLLPFLFARIAPPARVALAALLGLLAVAGLGLVMGQGKLPGEHTTAMLRHAVGDFRYAGAYYFCHLSPAENIDLLCYNYPTNVLLDDRYAHNLIPSRLALWFGAGCYPLALCLMSLGGMWLGVVLRCRRGGAGP